MSKDRHSPPTRAVTDDEIKKLRSLVISAGATVRFINSETTPAGKRSAVRFAEAHGWLHPEVAEDLLTSLPGDGPARSK